MANNAGNAASISCAGGVDAAVGVDASAAAGPQVAAAAAEQTCPDFLKCLGSPNGALCAGKAGRKPIRCNFDNAYTKIGKFIFFAALVVLAFLAPQDVRTLTLKALSDAYIGVSVFVAGTLAAFYLLEHSLKLDTAALLDKYSKWHVPIAAFMGVLPGCGGAIIVMTQYVAGRLGFSSVVAVLTATMGDAAFLLLAQQPETAALLFAISLVVGTLSGYAVELIHGKDFLRKNRATCPIAGIFCRVSSAHPPQSRLHYLWLALAVPGLVLGLAGAFHLDTDMWFGPLSGAQPTLWLGVAGALLAVFMWTLTDNSGPSATNLVSGVAGKHSYRDILDRVASDTNFVTVWVIGAFLIYELGMYWTGFDMPALFKSWGIFMPLIGVLIGFLPGCGPQIIVTTFYLQGLIPFSAQLANAISNDGDALFPAIAMAPRSAILATLYTSVPALIVGYAWYFIFG